MLSYRIDLTEDEDGSILVTSPDFPELTTFGESEAHAILMASGAIEEAVAARMHAHQKLPRPVDRREAAKHKGRAVALPALTALKVGLHRALLDSGLTRAELARSLGWHREQVDRLFRLDHASQIAQLEQAFAKLGSEIEIGIRKRKAA